jgi:hypothetical protein
VDITDAKAARRLAPSSRDMNAAHRLVLEFREFGRSEGWLQEGTKYQPPDLVKIPAERLPDVLAALGGMWGDGEKIHTFCRILDMDWVHGVHGFPPTKMIDRPTEVWELFTGTPYQVTEIPPFPYSSPTTAREKLTASFDRNTAIVGSKRNPLDAFDGTAAPVKR